MWPLVLVIPSTTVLVLNSFPPAERGKGLSLLVGHSFQQGSPTSASRPSRPGAIMFVAFLVALALMQPGRETATE
jgi:hypothetical protein